MWIKIKNWKSTKWLYIFIIFALEKNVFRQIRKISKNWIWIKKPWKLVRNLNEYFRTCFWFSIFISSWISISKLSRDIHVLLLLMLLHLLYFNILFHLPSQIFISKFQYFFFHKFYLKPSSKIKALNFSDLKLIDAYLLQKINSSYHLFSYNFQLNFFSL